MKCEACRKNIYREHRSDSEGYLFHKKCFEEVFSEELAAQDNKESTAHLTTPATRNEYTASC